MAPSTKKTKQAAPAAPAPEEEQQAVDPLADASLADLEDEITTGPAANWEVAYVFAFVERFTHLVDYDATHPVLPNVMTFEQALIDSSPPASAFARAAAAGASSNPPTRTSARLLEETTKQRTMPLTAVAIRNAAAAAANGGNGAAGAEMAAAAATTNGDKPQQQRRSGSPASSLSSLTASESGGDNTGTTTTPQDEAAYLAAIQAVETASVPSSSTIDPVPPVLPLEHESPPTSDLLKTIVETFIENLRPIKELSEYHGKKTWFHFLINFVSYRFSADPLYRGGFRWETNLLRTRGLKPGQEKEDKWWKLRWEDKIHLLRQMVDFQLTNAPAVRDLIKEQYDIGHQRNTRRDPSENYLVLPPAGRTSTHVTLFHLDSSPRLYACGNLYKSDSPWIAVSSTLKGYKAFVKTLAEPTSVERKAAELGSGAEAEALLEKEREKQLAAAARAAAAKKNKKGGPLAKAGGGRGKGKGTVEVEVEVGEDRMSEERMTRARLEEDLKDMAVYEKHLAALEARRMRASERAARNLSKGFNTPPVAATRSSRLRAREGASLRAVNYNENDDGDGDCNNDNGGDSDDDEDDEEGGGARRKRRRLDDADGNDSSLRSSAAPSEAGPSGAAAAASTSTTSRRGGARQSIPGKRRSSRLQQLPAAEPSERDESEPAASASGSDAGAGAEAVGNAPPKMEAEAEVEVEVSLEEQGKREEKEPAAEKEEDIKRVPVATTAAVVVPGQDGSTIPATPEEPALLTPFLAKAEGAAAGPASTESGEAAAAKETQQQPQPMEDVQPAPTAEEAA